MSISPGLSGLRCTGIACSSGRTGSELISRRTRVLRKSGSKILRPERSSNATRGDRSEGLLHRYLIPRSDLTRSIASERRLSAPSSGQLHPSPFTNPRLTGSITIRRSPFSYPGLGIKTRNPVHISALRYSTDAVVTHVEIPKTLKPFLQRPAPIDPPQSVTEGGEISSVSLRVGGLQRLVHFYIPRAHFLAQRSPGTLPLLICLHGSTEHGLQFESSSSSYAYDELACQEGFIVAYPDAYKGNWNDGRVNVNFPAVKENIDDIAFMKSLISHSAQHYGTHPEKSLFVGYSNGGQFALRLVYEPNRPPIAGIGVHCTTLPEQENNTIKMLPRPSSRVPVVMVNGTADPVNPYEGGTVVVVRFVNGKTLGDRGLHMGGLKAGRHLAASWDHVEMSEPITFCDDSLSRRDWIHRDINGGTRRPVVRLVSMIGEGHHISVPGGSKMPAFLGPTLEKVHSPREVIDFFKVATNALS